ncbi:MAG: hypothetical protein BroJett040_23720 [Oligoflexia bacterium]|nr:MAG: hypothetical protein BroJett040_23720 [Oligoflexia bacterium]
MSSINFKREMNLSVDQAVEKVTEAIKPVGFGILTRIDFHTKMKEKLNKDMEPVVILGACNPQLAFEAFEKNTDVTSLMPCNVVVRSLGPSKVSIEMIKPSKMMEFLNEPALVKLAEVADAHLQKALESLK